VDRREKGSPTHYWQLPPCGKGRKCLKPNNIRGKTGTSLRMLKRRGAEKGRGGGGRSGGRREKRKGKGDRRECDEGKRGGKKEEETGLAVYFSRYSLSLLCRDPVLDTPRNSTTDLKTTRTAEKAKTIDLKEGGERLR